MHTVTHLRLDVSVEAMELQVLDYPLKILRLSGLDPRDNSWLAKLISFLTATTMFALFVTSVMQIVIEESSLTIVAPVVEAMTAASAVAK